MEKGRDCGGEMRCSGSAELALPVVMSLANSLLISTNHGDMVDMVLEKLVPVFPGCRVCFISLQQGRFVIENGVPFDDHGVGETIQPEEGGIFLKSIIDGGRTVIVNDPSGDKRLDYLKLIIEKYEVSGVMFSPLRCPKGEDLGLLIFDALKGKKFCEEDALLAEDLSQLVSSAIQRERRHKKEKDEVARKAKMAALGENAAGVAHTIGNITQSIIGFSSLLEESIPLRGRVNRLKIRQQSEMIHSSAKKLDRVVKNVLSFSRSNVFLEKCNLGLLLAEEVGKLKLTHPGIQFETNLNSISTVSLMVDPHRFVNCLDDLVINASAAGAKKIIVESEQDEGRKECVILITDDGGGIEPQVIGQVFNPFMTTKTNGTGLGLALVSTIVEKHGGNITVKSKKGETVFRITLPIPEIEE